MQIASARDATIPSGSSLTEQSGPLRNGSAVSAAWTFELATPWAKYRSQLTAVLRRVGYEPVSTSGDSLTFSKHVPGDSYRVTIDPSSGGSKTRVTVTFSASPD